MLVMMMMISQKSLFIPASLFFFSVSCHVMLCHAMSDMPICVLCCFLFMLGPVMQDEKTLIVCIYFFPSFPLPFVQSINQSFQQTKGVIVAPSLSSPSLFRTPSHYCCCLCAPPLCFFLSCFFFALLLFPPLSSSLLPHLPTLFFIFPHGFLPCSHWKKLSSQSTLLKNNHWGGGMRVGGNKSTREGVTKPTISHPEREPKESVRESLKRKKKVVERGCRVVFTRTHIYNFFFFLVVCC